MVTPRLLRRGRSRANNPGRLRNRVCPYPFLILNRRTGLLMRRRKPTAGHDVFVLGVAIDEQL